MFANMARSGYKVANICIKVVEAVWSEIQRNKEALITYKHYKFTYMNEASLHSEAARCPG